MISRLGVQSKPKHWKMSQVNLDALIPREDMFIPENSKLRYGEKKNDDFKIGELELKGGYFYPVLKKPDFQRETSDWTPEKVHGFIKSFINEDLIPAIILWYSGEFCFVIDGAHRLSALIAWVNDDYGDGDISRPFFTTDVDSAIYKFAKKTRDLIAKDFGTYQSIKNAHLAPKPDPKKIAIANSFATASIQLQWVRGDSGTAEKSFFKINESATPINQTEKKLLYSRNKPDAIAARAIIHSGGGHKYWEKFSIEKKEKIEGLAKQINDILFMPRYTTPIDTTDLPIAGHGYSNQSLELIFNIINLSNNIEIEDKAPSKKREQPLEIPNDETGDETIRFLKNTKSVLGRITGKGSPSLGLHPAIYFYSDAGRYQFTSLMAWVELIKYMDAHRSFDKFTKIRRKYEDFFLKNKIFIHQIISKYGSGVKSYKKLFRLFNLIITCFEDGKNEGEIMIFLKQPLNFPFLKPGEKEIDPIVQKSFSTESKSMIFFKSAFPNPQVCPHCSGYYYGKGANADHITPVSKGGLGNVDNGQMMHGYCNSLKSNKTDN
ncbi:MAG: hypothetical protein JWQ06_432 [Mucilaginibacter sp.]|nr:hypothetical protein [Mucilaginibacter sp.]